jgi:hypothetical protein
MRRYVFCLVIACSITPMCIGYCKIFDSFLQTQPPTLHPKASKHELWALKGNLRMMKSILNQDSIEISDKEHILIMARFYIAGPLVKCKNLNCSRCDLYKYQLKKTVRILLTAKHGKHILDILRTDTLLKENNTFLRQLEKMKLKFTAKA